MFINVLKSQLTLDSDAIFTSVERCTAFATGLKIALNIPAHCALQACQTGYSLCPG